MNITLITSDQSRHNYLINSLDKICNKLLVIQEKKLGSKLSVTSHTVFSKYKNLYFKNVLNAEKKIFGNCKIKKNIKILKIKSNINDYDIKKFKDYLKSDLFIVYGSNFIKGKLLNFLISKKAIGLHMGISPYYRGVDCNFWAIYDNKPELVGATIFMLAKGLDDGKILFHTFPKNVRNPFVFSMSAVKAGFKYLIKKIKNDGLLKIKPIKQNKKNEIRYSRLSDFTDEVVKNFNNKKININFTKIDKKKFVQSYKYDE